MKHLLLALSITLLTFSACNKDDAYQNTGIITGPDYSMCMCCGGWLIEIDNTTYRFYELPEGSDFNLEKPTYPIMVKLNWKMKDPTCMGDEIVLEDVIMN